SVCMCVCVFSCLCAGVCVGVCVFWPCVLVCVCVRIDVCVFWPCVLVCVCVRVDVCVCVCSLLSSLDSMSVCEEGGRGFSRQPGWGPLHSDWTLSLSFSSILSSE